jgi:glycosyltransferase involved in cell wall biosynthesis
MGIVEKDQPLISVVMSVFNGEKRLLEAIQSILSQTLTNFEFIIINDGSTDKTKSIIEGFNDPRIRLINQKNHGLVYSLNRGISLARGEFIVRFDADDISMPSRFEKEIAWLIKDKKRGLVGSFFTYIDEDSGVPGLTLYTPTKHIDLCRMMYFVNPLAHGSTMFRREAFEEAGGYRIEYFKAEDYDLWRRIAVNWEIGQIPESLYWYRICKNSISQVHNVEQNQLAKKISEEQFNNVIYPKSAKEIVKDMRYYQSLPTEYNMTIADQYLGQQKQLACEFLWRGKIRTGFKSAIGVVIIRPRYIKELWKVMLWAPFKLVLGKSIK